MWYPLMCVRLWLTCTWVHCPMMTFPPRHTPQFCSKYFLEMSQQLLFFSWRPFQTRLGNHVQTAHQQQKGCRQASKGDQSLWVESYPISRPVQTRRREETHLKFAGWKPRESSVKIPTNCHILVIINDIRQNFNTIIDIRENLTQSSIFINIMPHCIYIPDLIIIQALPGVSLKTTSHLPAWVVRLRLALWRLQQQAKAPLRPLRPSHCAGWMHLRRRYPETPWPWLLLRWDEMDHENVENLWQQKKLKKMGFL